MRRPLLSATLLAATLVLTASGCNCGRQMVTMTQSSLSLPVEVLDFGVVPEGTSKGSKFRVDNVGRAPVNITVSVDPAGSADFTLGMVPMTVEAGGFVEVPVTFTPVGGGSDEGAALVTTEGLEIPLRCVLKGGPLEPRLAFVPNPLAFGPGNLPLERKPATIRSVGTSALNVRSVGVDPTGSLQFAVELPTLPARLLPGEQMQVMVAYARTADTRTGFMEVLSDDADAGRRLLELFPDPPTVCTDRVDNDGDGLIDFPQDPGCQDATDEDESNAAQCVNGAVQPCDIGACMFAGNRTCANNIWGMCMGSCDAGVPDAGFDAGVDAGTNCDPLGTYTLDAGSIAYSCCDGLGFPLVSININRFQIQAGRVRPLQTQPGGTLPLISAAPVCPSGSFSYEVVDTGMGGNACVETYTLTGTFVGPNTFVGTYTADFSGADCSGALCGGNNCTTQTWNISAGR
ncbi:MAG: choice-of-anchor D domain-containing protein [Archangium sp.]|nr:choice-of-anchor D domain-containing protein [Archangium sp.]